MKRFTLRLDDDLHKKFKNYCKERSLTMKAKLVELINKEIQKEKEVEDITVENFIEYLNNSNDNVDINIKIEK